MSDLEHTKFANNINITSLICLLVTDFDRKKVPNLSLGPNENQTCMAKSLRVFM